MAFWRYPPLIAVDEGVVFVADGSVGQVLERRRKGGTICALRFRAYGERRYLTLGGEAEGWTRSRAEAEDELQCVLADVERGLWVSPLRSPSPHTPREAYFGRLERAAKTPTLKTVWRIADGFETQPSDLLARAERLLDNV